MSSDFTKFVEEAEAFASDSELRELENTRAQLRRGSRLVEQRIKLGLTQQELAALTGVSQADISRIERGLANPTSVTLDLLSRPLRVALDVVPSEDVETAEA
jgi:XRE family transcriptional regulator, regulator of sulfur utilization